MIAAPNLAKRKRRDTAFQALCFVSAALGAAILLVLLGKIVKDGAPHLTRAFLTDMPSMRAGHGGIKAGLIGTLWIMGLTSVIAMPIGIAAAIYLEEFTTRKTRFTDFIQMLIANLAGVPSIVYGLLGLAVFVRAFQFGPSVLAGAATMSLLILPMVIIITQEALRAVPRSYREASLALGSTQWQAIRRQVLPAAGPAILTGVILAAGRAIGETAPLIVVGVVSFATSIPTSVGDRYTALPIHIFDWAKMPQQAFHEDAAAAIVVLIASLLCLNSIAIFLRAKAKRYG